MIKISFHNVDNSNALSHFLLSKTKKLQKFLGQKIEAKWVIDSDGKDFKPHLNILTQGKVISLHSRAKNAFVAASEILAKAKNILSKRQMRNKRAPKFSF